MHAALLSTILGVLAGRAPAPRDVAAPLREELSEAELRVLRYLPSNLTAPEIAAELTLGEHGADPHASDLREARRAQPRGGRHAGAEPRAARAPPARARVT